MVTINVLAKVSFDFCLTLLVYTAFKFCEKFYVFGVNSTSCKYYVSNGHQYPVNTRTKHNNVFASSSFLVKNSLLPEQMQFLQL